IAGDSAIRSEREQWTVRHECSSLPDRLDISGPIQLVSEISVKAARSDDGSSMQSEDRVFTCRGRDFKTAVQRTMINGRGLCEVSGAGVDLEILESTERQIHWKPTRNRVACPRRIARPRMDVSTKRALLSCCQKHVRVAW